MHKAYRGNSRQNVQLSSGRSGKAVQNKWSLTWTVRQEWGALHSSKSLGRVSKGEAAVCKKAQMHKAAQHSGMARLAGAGGYREQWEEQL